jgi:ribosomal protein S18 acetylase RimI-like enzyme
MIPRAAKLSIRPAGPDDFTRLCSFLNYRSRVHRHLDWRSALDWLDSQPYLLAESDGELLAVLACPPDPPSIAWIRLFTAATELSPARVWSLLLERAVQALKGSQSEVIAALAIQAWFEELLILSGFTTRQSIVVLEREDRPLLPRPLKPGFSLRPMLPEDIQAVTRVDHQAFEPLWQNSSDALELARMQSMCSTIIEFDREIVAYQISTAIGTSGHLARLAVLPPFQGRGLGQALVYQLLADFDQQGIRQVTVNTQNDNQSSLALYTRLGFHLTGDEFPVYCLTLPQSGSI